RDARDRGRGVARAGAARASRGSTRWRGEHGAARGGRQPPAGRLHRGRSDGHARRGSRHVVGADRGRARRRRSDAGTGGGPARRPGVRGPGCGRAVGPDSVYTGEGAVSHTVLVCDDAIFMRTMISDILAQAGFEIVGEAETGSQAVEKYRQLKPDLVTMDIVMPDM